MNRLQTIKSRLEESFPDHIIQYNFNIRGRMRCVVRNGNFLDIRWPRLDSYSFHYQSAQLELRIDCAPHHDHLNTKPNHFHKNEQILNDDWTDPTRSLEFNIRGLIQWIQTQIIPNID